MSILVTYATYSGSTAEVARVIGEILSAKGEGVEVLPITEVKTIESYAAVVIGSPIHSGKWLPEALSFVNRYQATLRQKPTALFVLTMRLRHNSEETRRSVAECIAPIRQQIKPMTVGAFAGVMDYSKLSSIMRLQVQTKGLPEGDFRQWEKIRAWVKELPF